jgi:hypothetical protein
VNSDNATNRVAQVLAIIPNRPPEPISELVLTPEDLNENRHTIFSLAEQRYEEDSNDAQGVTSAARSPVLGRNVSPPT